VNHADYAGAFIPGFVSALVERGCEVTVVTPDKAGTKEPPADHAVRWFKWAGSDRPIVALDLRSPRDLQRIFSLLREGERALSQLVDAQLVDSCFALWAVPGGYLARRACGGRIPYSVWALGSDIHVWARRPAAGWIVRDVLRHAAHRFADGVELAGEVRRVSGLDCDFLPSARRLPAPAPLPKALGSGVNFLFVGRLEPVKGADVIVEAVLQLIRSGMDVRLTMCGTGSLFPALQQQIEDGRAGHRVQLLADVTGDVVAALMSACDCLVVPSRNESIPVVFSESLQAGIPLLVTDVGDMGDLARKHGLAKPVPPGDPSALADSMRLFALNPDGHRAAYEKARAELMQVFDIGAMADRFLSITAT